ncbi:TlpA family protein disulfide reductase [Rhodobacterales bacterium]|nr:TlpA family protein disulfide reductase [Rhodobacterales bacterium]
MKIDRRAFLGGCALAMTATFPAVAASDDLRALGLAKPAFAIEPELGLPDLAGNMHDVSDYAGKTVVVSFWATWCAPCRKEMPTLARLGRELGNEKFAVLAVNVGDGEDRIGAFIDEFDHQGLTVLLDSDKAMPGTWYLRGLPVTYVLSPSGEVILAAIGERVWDSPEMIAKLRDLS